LTDVHTAEQCAPAAEVCDVLQIPAFLCRQTDLLEAAGRTGKPVNIKKGQWLQPEGMRGAAAKVRGVSPHGAHAPIAVTERGTFFGYGDLVVDMRNFTRMRDAAAAPVVYDATHSVQRRSQLARRVCSSKRIRIRITHPAMARTWCRWRTFLHSSSERSRSGAQCAHDRSERCAAHCTRRL
jgi:3-deoxy-8-phosphooctulonate synthase